MVAPEAWRERINIDPAIMGGNPVIRGTRVPVKIVVGALAGGSTIGEVCEGWGLTEEDVRAALAYAASVISREPADAVPGR